MKIEIITIGDEILIGQIIDTNSAWMAKELNNSGFKVNQIVSITDDKQHIIKALNEAEDRADVILLTGGLGPTKDDITKKTLCEYFGSELIRDQAVLEDIKSLFKSFDSELIEVNRQQADVPSNCKVIRNSKGTAPGMWFDQNKTIIVSMPGVPYEMKEMMRKQIIPDLCNRYKTPTIIHKTILTQGIGESFLAKKIEAWEASLSKCKIKLAYLPSAGIVRLRLSTSGNDRDVVMQNVNRKIKELEELIPSYIFGYENDTLEKIVGELLRKKRSNLATAESCTGGYIAHIISSVPGSSAYFHGSVVAYSDLVKHNILGVNNNLILEKGAVSKEVVREMALGILNKYNTDYAISCSGIAVPSGCSEDKPVGTVWIGVASKSDVVIKKFNFGSNRQFIIRATALTSLNLLRKILIA